MRKKFKKQTHETHERHETHMVKLYIPLSSLILRKAREKINKFRETHETHETQETRNENYGFMVSLFQVGSGIVVKIPLRGRIPEPSLLVTDALVRSPAKGGGNADA